MTSSYQQIASDFQNKKIVVMGLGIQGGGIGVVNFFQKLGTHITITDLRSYSELETSLNQIDLSQVKLSLGGHKEEDFINCDCVIRNPAVPRDNKFLKIASDYGKPVYLETALFAKYATRPIVGITGTRGKSTTTTVIYNLLKSAGRVTLGGNLPGSSTIALLESESDQILAHILELSSWQLQGFDDLKVSPHIAVLTNVYPDHLNRYSGMAEYIRDKAVITKYQANSDYFVYNAKDPVVQDIAIKSSAQLIPFSSDDLDAAIMLKLPGSHNRSNAAAAQAVARIFNLPQDTINQILSQQESIPFRLETIANINGVEFINDTTSTTPVALMTALNAQTKPTTLIMGGQSKNLPLEDVIETLNTHPIIKHIILIPGTGTNEITPHIQPQKILALVNSLQEALELAIKNTQSGETILFSPGYTSFDQYRNEFERGRHFNQLVLDYEASN